MSEIENTFKGLKAAKVIVEVYDAASNKNTYMLTPKGAEWRNALNQLFGSPENSAKKFTIHSPKKETVNKVMNKVLDGMEAVAKFGQSIDKSTGGKPKLNSFQQGNIFSSQNTTKKKRYVKRKVKKKHEKTKTKRRGMDRHHW